MTAALERSASNGRSGQRGAPHQPTVPGRLPQKRGSYFSRDPAWPLTLLLGLWPLWWALGIGTYTSVVFAIPMARQLYLWRARRERRIMTPPAFGMWMLFIVIMLAGIFTLHLTAPDTVPGPVSHRLASWFLRALAYIAATIIVLYVGNLTEREMPRQRLAWLMGLVTIYTVAGGLLGVGDPGFHFTSPLAAVVPASIQASDVTIASMLHPSVVEHATFQGLGRPSAPFNYANGWGGNFAILVPWLVVAWRKLGTRRQRIIADITLGLAIIPVVFSFDRGLWIGLVLSAIYIIARLLNPVNMMRTLIVSAAVILVFIGAIFATPLHSLISTRLSHASSDAGRASQSVIAVEGALHSPILGYGDTRHMQGSTQSITIGATSSCADCGSLSIGGHGQLWLLLFANGIPATIFYMGFFGFGVWKFRRDKSPYGLAGVLVILLGFVFSFVYLTIGIPLTFTMIAYGLLWRNDMQRRQKEAAAKTDEAAAAGGGSGRAALPAGSPA